MKHISKEEFFNQLNSCEYGRQYLELVNNTENHLGKKDKGEVHHIHPKKMGGDLKAKENLVKLTTFNHCLAHVLLAKAAMQLHSNWIGEAKMMLIRLGAVEFRHLSEAEQITLEKVHHWSELRAEGHKEAAKKCKEAYKNKSLEEKKEIGIKISKANKKRYEDPNEHKKLSDSQIKRYEDPNEHKKISKGNKKRYEDPNEHKKLSDALIKRYEDPNERKKTGEATKRGFIKNGTSKKLSEAGHKRFEDHNERKKLSDTLIKRYEDPNERKKLSDAQIKRFEDPNERKKLSDAQIKRFEDPNEHKKISDILKYICNLPEKREANSKRTKENQNRPDVKEKKSKALKGKNKGKLRIINDNEPKCKMIFPIDLPYWESLGWYRAKKKLHKN